MNLLSGTFNNCYGIKKLELKNIDLDNSPVAIIYAPNGVMKTSLTKVFDDIAKGKETKDELFPDELTSYYVKYRTFQFNNTNHDGSDKIYVIKSFDEKFVSKQESITSLLADENTRSKYDSIMKQFENELKEFRANLSEITGLTKTRVEVALRKDFNIADTDDWPNLLSIISREVEKESIPNLSGIKYCDCINDKTESLILSDEFQKFVKQYIDAVSELLSNNPILNYQFNDFHAEQLGKQIKKYDLFKAKHKIQLNNGQVVSTLSEWESVVRTELDKLYQDQALKKSYEELRKMLNANVETQRLCEVITQHKELIPKLSDIDFLKVSLWKSAFEQMEKPLSFYENHFSDFADEIQALYEIAESQAEEWIKVVNEFNLRFKVPFLVRIQNKANVLLKDAAPHIVFEYHQSNSQVGLVKYFEKDELMNSLSMGERRAMYLLYVLFDIEAIKKKAKDENVLIVADDIADSFDYKNKFAIVEYLKDISEEKRIDLLILTHNYDFYRTVLNRLQPLLKSVNCLLAQRQQDGVITVKMMPYQRDFFRKVVVEKLKGNFNESIKEKYLIVSIPFYRNLCEYALLQEDYEKLTCLLHLKSEPINTEKVKMCDLFELIPRAFKDGLNDNSSNNYYMETLEKIARNIVASDDSEAFLENKLILSIAIRLEAEVFLKKILVSNNVSLECTRNQTQKWTESAKTYLDSVEFKVIKEVNMFTAEGIHINSFMYEPLIDLSDWALKALYIDVLRLNGKTI